MVEPDAEKNSLSHFLGKIEITHSLQMLYYRSIAEFRTNLTNNQIIKNSQVESAKSSINELKNNCVHLM